MSLSSSLFTGTSGLKNMGNSLQVTGNNISNINTIGFKKGRANFADTLYESMATQAGTGQMGRGMSLGSVSQNYGQGSFESTGNATDLSIGGEGFFVMRQSNSENTFYTRAGDFYFDKNGQLINPQGYIVQGWDLDEDTGLDIGSIKDLMLADFTNPPKQSELITAITNLYADAESKSDVLANFWDAGEDTHLESGKYEYTTTVKVYDALGSSHDISIFYDKKSTSEWEYIITMNPDEDKRNFLQETDSEGLLARGVIKFSTTGVLEEITMEELTGRLSNFQASGINSVDDVKYEIIDYDAIPLDGYGFVLEFDGGKWVIADTDGDGSADPPANYSDVRVVYSDDQNIHLTFSDDVDDDDPDLKIILASPPAANNTIGFDINKADDLHYQGIEITGVEGDNVNNTSVMDSYESLINNPQVMTVDSSDIGIVWNPYAGDDNKGEWYWSNPDAADSAGTLVTNMTLTSSNDVTADVQNATAMDMYLEDITLRFDDRDATNEVWDWNMPLKEEDIEYTTDITGGATMTIEPGDDGAVATLDLAGSLVYIELDYDYTGGTGWALTDTSTTNFSLIAGGDEESGAVEFNDGGSGTNSVITFSFDALTDDEKITFRIDPTPPLEYPEAVITSSAHTTGVAIDFNDDSELDIDFNVTSGGAISGTDLFTFNLDPNLAPPEYEDAVLKGDSESVTIDLDGSNDVTGEEDIVFSFAEISLPYGENTDPYDDRTKISFDVKGSTAWTEISKDSITDTGFFGFTTDFLGGEFGATEAEIQLDIGIEYDGANFVLDSLATTQYANSSSTIFQDADGYAAGDLQGVDVSADGTITGSYSNGQLIPLFRVGLAKFYNNQGLRNEGGNLFSETRDSGAAITNKPGENGLGTIAPNSLEMSNVDIAEEFVSLITNQRGFEANSKTITTVDDMMQTVIGMKR